MGYLFGGDTGETPESIANQRAVAQALAQSATAGGAPRTIGDGLAELGKALSARMGLTAAAKAQKAGQDSASTDFAGLFPSASAGGAAPTDPALAGADVMANASAPTSVADFTASKEGFSPTAYKDGAQWSIGYGTKATPDEIAGKPISERDAKARLQQELGVADNYVSSNVKVPLNPNQRLALDDAAYNLGSFGPGLLGAINSGDPTAVPSHLAQYTGSWSPANQAGLANRRQAEISLWNSPVNGAPAAPVTAGAQPSAPSAPVQVASLDPTAGVAQALQAQPTPAGAPAGPSPGVAGVAQALSSVPAGGAPAATAGPSPGVATVAQAIGARSAPPQGAPVAPAPQLPQVPPAQLAAAQRILANRFSTPAEIAQATAVLTQARNYADPEYGIKLQTEQTQLQNLQHPPMSIQTLPGGTIVGIDTRTGQSTTIRQGAPATRPFTDQDRATFGIPKDQAGYVDANGAPHYLGTSITGTPSADDSEAIAKGIASGDIPPTTIGKNSKYNAPVTAYLAKNGTNLAQLTTDWNATQKFYAALDGTAQVRLRQNIDTLQGTLGTVRQLAEQWNAGGYPLLNAATRQAALQGALGPEANKIVTLLGQQVADVTGEMGSVLMGGNSPTDHALDLAAQNLSADWSYPTLTAALDQLGNNISFRKNAILNSAPADSGNNPYFNAGGGTTATQLNGGAAPAPGVPPAGGAPAAGAPAATPTAAPPAAPAAGGGIAMPKNFASPAGTDPADVWQRLDPETQQWIIQNGGNAPALH